MPKHSLLKTAIALLFVFSMSTLIGEAGGNIINL